MGATAPTGELDGSFKRRTLTSNDKLLEQLLGKKAAKGHLASKSLPGNQQDQVKKGAERDLQNARQQDVSDDEEEGRAGMFKSKTGKNVKRKRSQPVPETSVEVVAGLVNDHHQSSEHSEGINARANKSTVKEVAAASEDEEEVRPSKKKAGSYLDQLLSEKAQKKKKKKQQP